jgi:hypothetical protein
MSLATRKVVSVHEQTLAEGGRRLAAPLRVGAVAAVIANPWAGRGFVEDLSAEIDATASALGELLAPRLVELLDAPIEAYGKAAIVGLDGDVEHASALIHTLRFGNHLRDAVGGTSLLPAVEKRAVAGAPFDIPLKHVTDATTRSHHQTFELRIADAPHAGEILVALAGASGGRPHARLPAFASETAAADLEAS